MWTLNSKWVPKLKRNLIRFFLFMVGIFLIFSAHIVLETANEENIIRDLLNGYENTFLICIFTGFFLIFFIILENRDNRLFKGIFLIVYGAIFSSQYSNLVLSGIDESIITYAIKANLELLSQIAIFASAGAGGSLIASHSDKFSEDNDENKNKNMSLDKTKKIEDLKVLVEDLIQSVFWLKLIVIFLACLMVFKAI